MASVRAIRSMCINLCRLATITSLVGSSYLRCKSSVAIVVGRPLSVALKRERESFFFLLTANGLFAFFEEDPVRSLPVSTRNGNGEAGASVEASCAMFA